MASAGYLPGRLSSLLRAHFSPQQERNFSIDQELQKRAQVFKRQRPLRKSGLDQNSVGLTWDYFEPPQTTRRLEPALEAKTKEMRPKYQAFLKQVQEILGEEVPSEALHSTALFVYKTLSTHEADSIKKNKLKEEVGHVPAALYSRVLESVNQLHAWKGEVEVAASETNGGIEEEPSGAEDGDMETEFGADFKFNLDSDFLLEVDVLDEERIARRKQKKSKAAPAATRAPTIAAAPSAKSPPFGGASHTGWEGVELERIDVNWLYNQCERHAQIATTALSVKELAASVLRILSDRALADLQLQSQLFELLGETSFEFIALLLQKRSEILSVYNNSRAGGAGPAAAQQPSGPSIGCQITITSEQDKFLQKLQRKEGRKNKRRAAKDGPIESDGRVATLSNSRQGTWLAKVGWTEDTAAALKKQREEQLAQNASATGLENLLPVGSTSDNTFGMQAKIMLPKGSTRKNEKDYEEVFVPYPEIPPLNPEQLVPITEFDEWARVAFPNITHLNRIQSRVFQAAYRSNENLLICAPTGAGKTNVAMMTILHEVGLHMTNGILLREGFKIVYVAPMKALAQEMVENFGKRLKPLGVIVRELTGDMQLTKKELAETQMIVTTPEKWDVITRKTSDMALASIVRLLIIDEVHLLHEERGPVIETLVARTLRQVESTQSMIRIVGLSATLPNYEDVAVFLRVNPQTGLFHFNNAYRPVPLNQIFIGVKPHDVVKQKKAMNQIAYEKALHTVRRGQQAMIFVHSRNGTVNTAQLICEIARENETAELFKPDAAHPKFDMAMRDIARSRNKEMKELFMQGFGIHHAGMLRADRNVMERLFAQGLIKVLVCTATLAWGVNLPAHTVIIKGTQLYDSKKGSFVELGMLDVMQIFGRAGRPQYDTSGEGIIITAHSNLAHYLSLMNHQLPIESQFISNLADNLNAEVVSGTVTNLDEAVEWLSYTYLYVRMLKNPLAYGITYAQKATDPLLEQYRAQLIISAAKVLDASRMSRFHLQAKTLDSTHLGRMASHFYLRHETVQLINETLDANMPDENLLDLLSHASEFENMKVREEEMDEMQSLLEEACVVPVKGEGITSSFGKVNVLFQAFLSHAQLKGFALVSDLNYVTQNVGRILRALFEIVLQKGWTRLAERILDYCKMTDLQMWDTTHPLQQFKVLSPEVLFKLQAKRLTIDRLYDMEPREIGALVSFPKMGPVIKRLVRQFPTLDLDVSVQPITRTILRTNVVITPDFDWNDRIHGTVEPWWIWVEDPQNEHIYHSEYFLLEKKSLGEPQKLSFTIPIFEPLPSQYILHAASDRWLHAGTSVPISFKHLILPDEYPPHTPLLDLQPLPITALHNAEYQKLYSFTHFNPVQTQIFHTLYHTDHNVLLGAPTGSGKTVAAELAMMRLFNETPHLKAVYIGPLKALVRERMKDWKRRFVDKLGKKMVELTGDFTPDVRTLKTADIVTTTPEKWDGISRNWQQRGYVKAVGLIIIDEVHLLGADRGPILEVIVSRMRYISSQTKNPIRLVCLSTAVANARDLADWLGIEGMQGLFNFRPSVRPVPLEVHIQGYAGKHYCPRMATMNKPTYTAIVTHSPFKPVLVFVSSRRQTRLTALDLISFCTTEGNPQQFLNIEHEELEEVMYRIRDKNLKHTLQFGIGLHHAGLPREDKALVERLFRDNKIQVLVSTSTLAWGVNLPAHLVVIKGTEYYDANTRRYLDFPITDVLQMMGRAGRPQYDQMGKAVIMVHEPKKNFYKKFLYEPFPVESSLHTVLHDHFNAEIVSGTITTKQDAVDYLTWTYLFRRLVRNPTYYGLEETDFDAINRHLSEVVDTTLKELADSHCIEIDEEDHITIYGLTFGRIASYYYLHHATVGMFYDAIDDQNSIQSLLKVLCDASEYDELPVRHNEDKLNEELATQVPWPVDARLLDDPHAKAYLLFQAHFSKLVLPISDYITDTKSVLDQSVRILQAMVDVAADGGWLFTALNSMQLTQMVMQGQWFTESTLFTLPHATEAVVDALNAAGVESVAEAISLPEQQLRNIVAPLLKGQRLKEFMNVAKSIPLIDITVGKVQWKEEQYGLKVELSHANKNHMQFAYTPTFPKKKQATWWLVLGCPSSGELLALRRLNINPHGKTTTWLRFDPPEPEEGQEGAQQQYQLYLMSDSYLGIDQQRTVVADASLLHEEQQGGGGEDEEDQDAEVEFEEEEEVDDY
ncbi:activating signal cointegrator 1 complex subunit [Balamuthia mandrillaris]